MSNHDPYSDSPSPLVGFSTTKVYSGIGADIVMESIAQVCSPWLGGVERSMTMLAPRPE
jgi:hypothetical protein